MRTTGKRIAIVTACVAVVVVGMAAFVARHRIAEEWWIYRLKSKGEEVRKTAVMRLGDLKSERVVPHLIPMLMIRSDKGVGGLIPIGFSEELGTIKGTVIASYDYQANVGEALVKIGARAVPGLVNALSGDRSLYSGIIWVLGEMGVEAKEAIPKLEELHRMDADQKTMIETALEKIRGTSQ